MEKIYISKNGEMKILENGLDIKVTSRSAQLNYRDISKVEYIKATSKKDGSLDIYSKKGNLRLWFSKEDNEKFKQAKKDILLAIVRYSKKNSTEESDLSIRGLLGALSIILGLAMIFSASDAMVSLINKGAGIGVGTAPEILFSIASDMIGSIALGMIGMAFIGAGGFLIYKTGEASKAAKNGDVQNNSSAKKRYLTVRFDSEVYESLVKYSLDNDRTMEDVVVGQIKELVKVKKEDMK